MVMELNLLPTLTVAENLFSTTCPAASAGSATGLRQLATAAMAQVGLDAIDPDTCR
jgi:ribose transport system ATP-binding protein